MTPQPTPQKRQGAFDHLSEIPASSAAWAGRAMPIAAAAAAAAWDLISSRRVIGMRRAPLSGYGFHLVEDQHRRDDPGQVFDLGKSHQEFSFTLRFQQDDDLTPNRHCLDFR